MNYFEAQYDKLGPKAQRWWPNEELIRYLTANSDSPGTALDIGCGVGGGLWALTEFGWDATGIDFCQEAVNTSLKRGFDAYNVDMRSYQGANRYDLITDVFSSYCLNIWDYMKFLKSMAEALKPGGEFFSFTPSVKCSDVVGNWEYYTSTGIKNANSPWDGHNYTFRFMSPEAVAAWLVDVGFRPISIEKTSRTRNGYYAEFLVIVAEKV